MKEMTKGTTVPPGGIKLLRNAPLKFHSTFRIGGRADLLALPKTVHELKDLLSYAHRKKMRTLVIGNGSNILFPDAPLRGLVIKLANGLTSIDIKGENVIASSGTMLSALVKKLASKGIGGLEFCYGVPATVGGAVVSNFGAWGDEIGKFVKEVKGIKVVGGRIKHFKFDRKKLRFKYRWSNLAGRGMIVTRVEFELKRTKPKFAREKMAKVLEMRRQKQPLAIPNIGSIFKNPPGMAAGNLIKEARLSGKRAGDAQISTKHANFIVNLGEAKQKDVLALIKLVQRKVLSKFKVRLSPEIKIIK